MTPKTLERELQGLSSEEILEVLARLSRNWLVRAKIVYSDGIAVTGYVRLHSSPVNYRYVLQTKKDDLNASYGTLQALTKPLNQITGIAILKIEPFARHRND